VGLRTGGQSVRVPVTGRFGRSVIGSNPPSTTSSALCCSIVSPASEAAAVGGRRVAGPSGTYCPTKHDCSRAELSGARRRRFVRADIEHATELAAVKPDLCPVGYYVHADGTFGSTRVTLLAPVRERYYTPDATSLSLSSYATAEGNPPEE